MDLTFPQCANVILHQFFHKWSRKRLGQLHKHYCTGTVKEQWIFGLTEPLDSSKARAEKWEIGTSLQTPFASESQINSVPWLCARNLDPFWFKNWEREIVCIWRRGTSRGNQATALNASGSSVWNDLFPDFSWLLPSIQRFPKFETGDDIDLKALSVFNRWSGSSLRAAWRWLLTNISLSMVNKPRRQWWGGAYVRTSYS